MNIHFIPDSVFARDYVTLLEKNFSNYKVYVYSKQDHKYNYENYENVIAIKTFRSEYLCGLGNDKLFFHSFYDNDLIRFIFINQHKINFRNVVFVIWGADLYNNYFLLKDKKLHIRTRINEFMKHTFLKKCSMFMTFASPDFDLLCKLYGAKGKQFDCLYPSSINKKSLDDLLILQNEEADNSVVRILVGNSATRTNNHMEMLETLKKYVEENIKIYCPLSYGDMNYAKSILEYGRDAFGEKFVPITEYMSPEKYSEFLNTMDIAIFHNSRQQATANIEILGYLGKKIYIRSDTSMWGHYHDRDGCRVFDSLNIESMGYAEFIQHNKEDVDYNRLYFSKIWNEEYICSLWRCVL